MQKIGIITFHNSYNCGSMLESYAIQKYIENLGEDVKIINFSNKGQRQLYSIWHKNNSIKNIIRNILLIPAYRRIKYNNNMYETFKIKNFNLTEEYNNIDQLSDKDFDIVIAGSDQIWNITISDADDAYFLPWVKKAKKVAYAPSFGSKNILKYSENPKKYANFISDFDALSVREKNGKKWIKDLTNIDVEILIDPTLLLESKDYDEIMDKGIKLNKKFIFFYSPDFDIDICRFVRKIARKYKLEVITWSTKPYFKKLIKRFGFKLPEYENPSMYLSLMKNAELILTTSFHGTIFSSIYRKKFFTIKNGGMYGDDDRVITLLTQLGLLERLIPYEFDDKLDYLNNIDYTQYERELPKLKDKAKKYINNYIGDLV